MFHILVFLRLKNIDDFEFVKKNLKQVSEITLEEEPCCRRLDVYHSESNPLLFILCEEWGKREDWEAHREKRAFKEIYLPKVLPLVEREPHISIRINKP